MRSRVRLLTCALAAMAASTDLDAQTMSPASAAGPSVVGGAGGCRCGTTSTVRYAFDYGQAGWEHTLKRIPSRTLGEGLDQIPKRTYAQKF